MLAGAHRTLVLLSGGVESAVLLAQLKEIGQQPMALFAHYAQRGAEAEHRAAIAACSSVGLAEPQLLDLRTEGVAHQRINRLHIPLPHRNLVLLSLALGWASTRQCSALAIGLNKDDFGKDAEFKATGSVRYTTGTRDFVERFTDLAAIVAPEIDIILPQAHMNKAKVVSEGVRLGMPLAQTYSCMRGRAAHCGTCLQCRARRQAFVDADAVAHDVSYESNAT